MLGDVIIRCLLLVVGYAYPAFECFKTVRKNTADVNQLRFWCQYWIILAMVSIMERIILAWLPLYGEMKLALILYLCHPKLKGTEYVYKNLICPYFLKHETEFEKQIEYLRTTFWVYFQTFSKFGHSTLLRLLQYITYQSSKYKPQ